MPDNETPQLIPRLQYTKNWEDPADYATHQNNEVQNRKDLQSLFTEIATYLNNVMLPRAEQLIAQGGGSGSGGASGDYLPLDGGTMRGILRLWRDPVLDIEAATKQYADRAASRVKADADGRFTAIEQTAESIRMIAQDNEGDIAKLELDAQNILMSVLDALGNLSQIHLDSNEIALRVENAAGDFSQISQKADEISALVQDAEGNRSQITQRADEILSLITDILGNMSQIRQTADEISTHVEDHSGNASEIIQKADEIKTSVRDADGNASEIRQTADEIKTIVSNPQGDFSQIQQLADAISLLVRDALGHTSEIRQTATEITSTVKDEEGNLSEIKQTLDAIILRVQNAEGDISEIRQTVDSISLGVSTVTENGEVYSRLTLKIGPNELYGFIKMEGNVDVSGQLSAEALYAGYGEVANLAVDQLTTSRRIVRYLAGDASEDNFIRIYQQNVEWVTGTATGGTAQASNPDGSPLYWPVDVSGLSRGADGYPVTAQNERIFTTTTPTAYPVMVYAYNEAVKRSISFEPVNGIQSPVDRFGAGNAQGNNRAWILKTADGFNIRYLTPDNKEIGIRMTTDGKVHIDGFAYDGGAVKESLGLGGSGSGEGGFNLTDANGNGLSVGSDGYADISGLRKPVAIDFSGLGSGAFSETLDGGIRNEYTVTKDGNGRISAITDASGHVTSVVWG